MLKKLKDRKVPINGVGLQGHWSIYEPTAQALEESIMKFADLGLAIQFTEVDVSIYPKEHEHRIRRDTDAGKFTPELNDKQAAQYTMLFSVFRKHRDKITGITFWNLTDKHSWLDDFPVPGRKDYPLLFDQTSQPKRAFRGVVNF